MAEADATQARVEQFQQRVSRLQSAVREVIVGQSDVVRGVLVCMLAGSHALLEGVPGLGKTLLVRTLADCLGLSFSRIQFTPDLMPADIIGTTVIDEASRGRYEFEFRKGPLFANIVLADEVNRATPKTQSALLEAMQERRVTVGRTSHALEAPYFVLATQNPLEMEGTYPLPEAQLDRFFFKLQVGFPSRQELHRIIELTTSTDEVSLHAVLSREELLEMQNLVREVPAAHAVQDYAVRLLEATHPEIAGAPERVRRFVRIGASPRGAQALLLGAKITALLEGRFAAAIDDVRDVAHAALRHRVLMSFEGEAEGVRPDDVIDEILELLPEVAAA